MYDKEANRSHGLCQHETNYHNFQAITCTADYPHHSILATRKKIKQEITHTGR